MMNRKEDDKTEHCMSGEDGVDGYPIGIFTPPSMPTYAISAGTVSFVAAWKDRWELKR